MSQFENSNLDEAGLDPGGGLHGGLVLPVLLPPHHGGVGLQLGQQAAAPRLLLPRQAHLQYSAVQYSTVQYSTV